MVERNKNLKAVSQPFQPNRRSWGLRLRGGSSPLREEVERRKPRPSPGFGSPPVLPGRFPLSRKPAVLCPPSLRSSPLCHPAAPARPYPAPRAGSRSNSHGPPATAPGPCLPGPAESKHHGRYRDVTKGAPLGSAGGWDGWGRGGRPFGGFVPLGWRWALDFPPLLVPAPQVL